MNATVPIPTSTAYMRENMSSLVWTKKRTSKRIFPPAPTRMPILIDFEAMNKQKITWQRHF
jgi:hypothetical protein